MSSSFVNQIQAAESSVRPIVRETPLEHSRAFDQLTGAEVFFKCENLQHTGSFKYRGATNRIRSATPEETKAGFVTASTGNHGAGFARAVHLAGVKGLVFVPQNASATKLANIEQYGIEIRRHGDDGVITETFARKYAAEHHMTYVSPYNDLLVAAGQGTIGVELERQMQHPADVVYVSLGGGGLISGIGAYLKSVWPGVTVTGCSPVNSKVMIDSVAAGRILDLPSLPTLSDGTAGGVEAGAVTFELVRDLVDDYETVTEVEIAEAMRLYIDKQHQLVEGAAGVAIATMLKQSSQLVGKRVVVIVCGGNISLDTLATVIA